MFAQRSSAFTSGRARRELFETQGAVLLEPHCRACSLGSIVGVHYRLACSLISQTLGMGLNSKKISTAEKTAWLVQKLSALVDGHHPLSGLIFTRIRTGRCCHHYYCKCCRWCGLYHHNTNHENGHHY